MSQVIDDATSTMNDAYDDAPKREFNLAALSKRREWQFSTFLGTYLLTAMKNKVPCLIMMMCHLVIFFTNKLLELYNMMLLNLMMSLKLKLLKHPVTLPIQSYTNHTRKHVRSRSGTHGKISQHNSKSKTSHISIILQARGLEGSNTSARHKQFSGSNNIWVQT